MTFVRALSFLTYLVAGLGFFALFLSPDTGTITLLIILVGFIASLPQLRRFHPSEPIWRALTVLYLLFTSVQVLVLRLPLLEVATGLLIFLQLNRLFQHRRNRDLGYVLLLALLQILLGCILTIHPLFALVLAAFMILSTFTLLLVQLKSGLDEAAGGEDELEPPPVARYQAATPILRPRFMAGFAGVSLLMFLGTIALFLMSPRLESSLFQRHAGPTVHLAGFSDTVSLGEVGRIMAGRSRVMRVSLQGELSQLEGAPYWRGLGLDYFDGHTWRLSATYRERYHTRPAVLNRNTYPRGANLRQRYVLEPLDTTVIFVMPEVKGIESTLPLLHRNFTGSFLTPEPQSRLDYTVYSRVAPQDRRALRQASPDMPPRVASLYLQLPDLSPRVKALAEQLTASAANNYDKALAVEHHFHQNFTYSLDMQHSGDHPLEDFLFRHRTGHCEYFASGMVVLLRSVGIPARLVTGFMGGELNPVGQYYVVRQADAHAWVEVFFGDEGWVRFDPTPPGMAPGVQGQASGLGTLAEQYADWLEVQWYYYVLDYDVRAQLKLFEELFSAAAKGASLAPMLTPGLPQTGSSSLRLLPSLSLLILGGMFLALYLLRRRMDSDIPAAVLTPYGRRFSRVRQRVHAELDRRGYPRGAGETSLERAQRAEVALGGQGCLTSLERAWYAARFGDEELGADALTQAESAWRFLRSLRDR